MPSHIPSESTREVQGVSRTWQPAKQGKIVENTELQLGNRQRCFKTIGRKQGGETASVGKQSLSLAVRRGFCASESASIGFTQSGVLEPSPVSSLQ